MLKKEKIGAYTVGWESRAGLKKGEMVWKDEQGRRMNWTRLIGISIRSRCYAPESLLVA